MALAVGCAGTSSRPDSSSPRLDLALTDVQGRTLQLEALRGRPALLFLFATYDATSQLALARLMAAAEHEDRVTFLGIAVQPDARSFLVPFRAALDVQFPLYIDAEGALLSGETVLGGLPGIPAFVAVDAEGSVRRTFFGVPGHDELEALIESAL